MEPVQIGIVILMIGAIGACFVWLQSSEATSRSRRMANMMGRIGFDPKLVSLKDPQTRTVGIEVRSRCRKCPREDLCEQWLAGEVKGGHTFCPNATTFDRLSAPDVKDRSEDVVLMA